METIATMKIYTVEEVATILKIAKSTIYELLKEGEIRGVKIGRVYRISEKALCEFLEGKGY